MMKMQLHIYVGVTALALCLTCALAQAPKPLPPILVQDNSLVLAMRSANITLRMLDSRDQEHKASFSKATATVDNRGKNTSVTIEFGPVPDKITDKFTITSFKLTMHFVLESGYYWSMFSPTIVLSGTETGKQFDFKDAQLLSYIGLYAPEDLSFHCSRFGPLYPAEVSGNHTFVIDFEGFQIQPFSNNTNSFAPAYECVGFFSIGILSGIFVTLILMAILAWGLSMIMDIKTMDRFDDPKGKPVSFGGAE